MSSAPDPADRTAAVAAVFDRAAADYDQTGVDWFTPIGRRLVEAAAPRPASTALDVGVGRGAVLFPLADAVGRDGRLTAIDLAPGMVLATRAEVEERGLDNVDLIVMDAAAPDLEAASFDLVLSSLVLFFLPDPATALGRWAELLVPGGRLAVTTFGPGDEGLDRVDDLFRPYLPQRVLDARTSGAEGPFASDAGVAGLFEAAGLVDVRTVRFAQDLSFADPADWVRWSWSHGQRGLWEQVPEDRRRDLEAAAAEQLETMRGADGRVHATQGVRITLGRRDDVSGAS